MPTTRRVEICRIPEKRIARIGRGGAAAHRLSAGRTLGACRLKLRQSAVHVLGEVKKGRNPQEIEDLPDPSVRAGEDEIASTLPDDLSNVEEAAETSGGDERDPLQVDDESTQA